MNFRSLAVHPLIFPSQHKTSLTQASPAKRVSPSPLSQRQGSTFVDFMTNRAFINQEDAYPHVANFFKRHLKNHLQTFVQSGYSLPAGSELQNLLVSFENYYYGKANLLASHNANVNIKISPWELIVYNRYVSIEILKRRIETYPESHPLDMLLKKMLDGPNPPNEIPVIETPPDYLKDSHISNPNSTQLSILYLLSIPNFDLDNSRFINYVSQFTKVALQRYAREDRAQYDFWEKYAHKINAPHSGLYSRIPKGKVLDTPLMRTWRLPTNRTKALSAAIVGAQEIQVSVSNWILTALNEVKSYQPEDRIRKIPPTPIKKTPPIWRN
jgi:hypothetical protein